MTYEDKLKRYDELVAKCDHIERLGKSMPYTAANTHMFSLLNKDGEVGLRFSEEVKDKYIEELPSTIYKSYGAVMRGYVLIPEEMMENNMDRVAEMLNESYEYVMSLKANPRKGKK